MRKKVLRPMGPSPKPIMNKNGWVLRIFKGHILDSWEGRINEIENPPKGFMASVENPVTHDREAGNIHKSYEAAKAEGAEMLSKK